MNLIFKVAGDYFCENLLIYIKYYNMSFLTTDLAKDNENVLNFYLTNNSFFYSYTTQCTFILKTNK